MATQNQGWISAMGTWRYPKGAERKLKCKRNDSFRAAYELFKAMKLKTKAVRYGKTEPESIFKRANGY